MRNLKVTISYDGTAYHGFQKQNNAVTVQGTIETALSRLLKQDASITGCSRTDAGVHARKFCFNTRTDSPIPTDGFIMGLNSLLPRDIAVHSCETADDNFHARYSAKAKEYTYLIHNGGIRDVFTNNRAYFYPRPLNLELMNKAANIFIGEHDFSAYCKAESLEAVKNKKHGAIREIYDFKAVKSVKSVNGKTVNDGEKLVELIICGNGFLHNMVRIMAGTLLNINEGKMSLDDVRKSLSASSNARESAGVTLPACGLYLNRVIYDD